MGNYVVMLDMEELYKWRIFNALNRHQPVLNFHGHKLGVIERKRRSKHEFCNLSCEMGCISFSGPYERSTESFHPHIRRFKFSLFSNQ
ncbi:unnamed protein product [Victoria cruziana]